MSQEELKRLAAERAVQFVESGMLLGLGSGSTVFYALRRLGERIRAGELTNIIGVPTSTVTEVRATEFGIPLTTLNDYAELDLTIDGADEVAPDLNLVKGRGGALLREKIVAAASRRLVIIVDDSKLVDKLATRMPVPVEVIPFSWRIHATYLSNLGARPELRRTGNGQPYVTDSGHYILDCHFEGIDDPHALSATINAPPGIVENGLFVDMTDTVIIASEEGIQIKTVASGEI